MAAAARVKNPRASVMNCARLSRLIICNLALFTNATGAVYGLAYALL